MWDHGLARVSCLVQWDARCVCHCSDRPTDENFSVSLCFIRTPSQNKGSEVWTLIGHDFSALRLNTFQLVTSESQIILNWNEIIRALSCNALVISVTWCLVIIKLDPNCLKAVFFFPLCDQTRDAYYTAPCPWSQERQFSHLQQKRSFLLFF